MVRLPRNKKQTYPWPWPWYWLFKVKYGICYISAKMVQLLWNEKLTYRLNIWPQIQPSALTLVMTLTLIFKVKSINSWEEWEGWLTLPVIHDHDRDLLVTTMRCKDLLIVTRVTLDIGVPLTCLFARCNWKNWNKSIYLILDMKFDEHLYNQLLKSWKCTGVHSALWLMMLNTLRLRQYGRHFIDIFKYIFLNENVWTLIRISMKFVTKGQINNIPALVPVMTWRWPGVKPLSQPMMVRLAMHICITLPQWVQHHIINAHNTDKIFIILNQYPTKILHLWWNNIRK